MKMLIVNDDGIYSDGIFYLWKKLKNIHDIEIVAPLHEQSAASHSITLFQPFRFTKVKRKNEFSGWAVEGTPADSVKIALSYLFKDIKFDCIISGINKGFNTSNNILYSGTVSAATEGYLAGIPSIAISTSFEGDYLDEIAEFVKKFLEGWKESDFFESSVLLNINYPNEKKENIKGIKITNQGKSFYKTRLEKRKDPMGKNYYWYSGDLKIDENSNSDDRAIYEKYISITPLKFDLTDYDSLTKMKREKDDLWKKLKY
ncbi:MAG: 5'/3'-nucleotidase SurE [Candidatus Mcinerneyibacterium aminivorans]|jgi:5'-nucleotidase|uniref:5'-nucleotidase SurE n=1 Tax=Candidatus Mcinerneyibacterium aminivorans TaxID=2703815 RepID=A0A5D0MKS1_9BACT|nr:MAG: 5'/3'-nucleotidase SurE [Candidatus Mcinerneyibacterium aminivorans]